jgi:hypothetical protein
MTESVWSSVDDYVNFCEGTHAIKKILIANNGIGATKAIKSLRRWSYETFGDERMVLFPNDTIEFYCDNTYNLYFLSRFSLWLWLPLMTCELTPNISGWRIKLLMYQEWLLPSATPNGSEFA